MSVEDPKSEVILTVRQSSSLYGIRGRVVGLVFAACQVTPVDCREGVRTKELLLLGDMIACQKGVFKKRMCM